MEIGTWRGIALVAAVGDVEYEEASEACGSLVGVSERLELAKRGFEFASEPLTFLDVFVEPGALLRSRPNQCGNPCRRLKPPGGSLSSSVALCVSASVVLVLKV